jgi:hypothetical protein
LGCGGASGLGRRELCASVARPRRSKIFPFGNLRALFDDGCRPSDGFRWMRQADAWQSRGRSARGRPALALAVSSPSAEVADSTRLS